MRLYLDIEVYRNYFLALFMNEDGGCKRFEIFNGDTSRFPRDVVLGLLKHPDVEIFTFNGNNYDIPLLTFALVNPDTVAIKRASDRIITKNVRPWHFYKDEGLKEPNINHVDLIDVAPGMLGLKMYGGRLHSKRLQELPIEHTAEVTEEQAAQLRQYCKNDTTVTKMLREALSEQLRLREIMGKEYGLDLRSKSDAQIAEAVLKSEFQRLTGDTPAKVTLNRDTFFYRPPEYVRFFTEDLRETLDVITNAEMTISSKTGHVKMPKEIQTLKIRIGDSTYKIGIGGLHSQESEVTHYSDEENLLIDRDVASYYPTLMLNANMRPGGFGEHFNTVYRKILDERLEAKRRGDKVTSDALKISLNGTFGKTANKYSTLYSPEFMIQTTLTGQLSLLMLIEALELCGIPVVSANTDGVVIKCPQDKRDALNAIVQKWEKRTGLQTEETAYRALHSRDVNNYIAVKEDGSAKAKGAYGPPTLAKNPQNQICSQAVIEYLTKGVAVDRTVRGCQDITKFITLRTVTGGAIKNNEKIGKAIRWYYADDEKGEIFYAQNGNTVPRSYGARPLMDLPDQFPDDVDYDWYIKECEEILMAVGVVPRPVVPKIPRKNSKAWKELRDNGEIVEGRKGKWEWANQ